jgi:hypothetical protein
MKRIVGLVVLFLAGLGVTAANATVHCNWYWNSRAVYFPGYGDICASTGGGCSECWDDQSGDACVIDGWYFCDPQLDYEYPQ